MGLNWWEDDVIYYIYLPSFKDSNNDGIGDFQGLISKLDYFRELQISTLLLSPFYPSPMKDNGYDITCFTDIDPIYGTMEDFDALMSEVKERGLNIIIDFVANHTSSVHPWFEKSIKKESPYSDFFIWVDSIQSPVDKTPVPPNNWLSVFGGSAWTYNSKRKQFYYHQFLPEQPDLNYRNPSVKSEMEKVLKFWLDKGVDGFRIDAGSHLFEDIRLLDEPHSNKRGMKKNEYGYLDHIYTKGLQENCNLLEEWRRLLNVYEKKTNKSKLMLIEAMEDCRQVMQYYGSIHRKIADFPFNFELCKITSESSGIDIHKILDEWMRNMPKGKLPNWVLGSHDFSRVVSRVGATLAKSLQMLIMMLPGVPVCYYGDEIGMDNTSVMPAEMRDSFALRTVPSNSRDPMRTPMQWNAEINAGFSNCNKTWLPVNPNYENVNAEIERGDPTSFLETFKKLVKIRQHPSISFGTCHYPLISQRTFSFLSHMIGEKSFLLVLNMSQEPNTIDLWNLHPLLPEEATVEIANCSRYHTIQSQACAKDISVAGTSTASENSSECILKIHLSDIYLGSHEAILLSFIGYDANT